MNARIDLSYIDSAISYLESAAEVVKSRNGVDAWNRGKAMEEMAALASKQLRMLHEHLPRLLALDDSANRAYDRMVTSLDECCSCHLTAPCNYCINQPNQDEEENTP
jgi:hypothetical protein